MQTQSWTLVPGEPHSSRLAARLQLLAHHCLLNRLSETTDLETHAAIIEQARIAAASAWLTAAPLLVFPALFEERARAACERQQRQVHLFWRGLKLEPPIPSPEIHLHPAQLVAT